MLLASMILMIMIAGVKELRETMAPLEVMVWRTGMAAPVALIFAWPAGLKVRATKVLLLRSALGAGAMACTFEAAGGLSLADLSIIMRLQPIFVAVFAPIALGTAERSGRLIWGVLVVGLIGSTLIIGPGLDVGNVHGLYALAATVLSAAAHVAIRQLGKSEDPRVIVFWFQLFVCGIAFAAHIATTGQMLTMPAPDTWWILALIGVTATLGQIAMTTAYKAEQASTVAAATYAGPLFAMLIDLAFFDGWPSWLSAVGGVAVIVSGLILVIRSGTHQARGHKA